MLKSERHELICSRVEQNGKVLVNDLTHELKVTEDTIRKDLQELSKVGLIKRVHGGAIRVDNSIIAFEQRMNENIGTKQKVAKLAVPFLQLNQVIYIDSGTTNLSFTNEIPINYTGTMITNSPSIALNLCSYPNIQIHLLPGQLNKESKVLQGTTTLTALMDINIDLCLLGISSIDADKGITVPSLEESMLKRQMIKQSSQTIGIVTAEKIGTSSTYLVDDAKALDILVTEKNVSENLLKPYREKGIKIIS